jgi:hypothetical protein
MVVLSAQMASSYSSVIGASSGAYVLKFPYLRSTSFSDLANPSECDRPGNGYMLSSVFFDGNPPVGLDPRNSLPRLRTDFLLAGQEANVTPSGIKRPLLLNVASAAGEDSICRIRQSEEGRLFVSGSVYLISARRDKLEVLPAMYPIPDNHSIALLQPGEERPLGLGSMIVCACANRPLLVLMPTCNAMGSTFAVLSMWRAALVHLHNGVLGVWNFLTCNMTCAPVLQEFGKIVDCRFACGFGLNYQCPNGMAPGALKFLKRLVVAPPPARLSLDEQIALREAEAEAAKRLIGAVHEQVGRAEAVANAKRQKLSDATAEFDAAVAMVRLQSAGASCQAETTDEWLAKQAALSVHREEVDRAHLEWKGLHDRLRDAKATVQIQGYMVQKMQEKRIADRSSSQKDV